MGQRSCSLDGCEDVHFAMGFCAPHFRRWKRHGDPHHQRPRPGEHVCDVPGCDHPRSAREWCKRHYNNWARHGDPVRKRTSKGTITRGDGVIKTCYVCGITKALDEFSPNGRASPDGTVHLRNDCRACAAAHMNRRYRDDAPKFRARARKHMLMSKYGLSLEGFDALLNTQGGRCASCRGADPRGPNWAVDHCHNTGAVRGILCNPCNTALGLLKDDAELAIRLAMYRRRFDDALGELLTASQVHEEQGQD